MSTLFLLSLLRIYLHSTGRREELLVLPKIFEAGDEKPKPGKRPDSERSSDEKNGTTKQGPRRIKGDAGRKTHRSADSASEGHKIQTLVFYSSLTGSTEQIVRSFAQERAAALECSAEKVSDRALLTPRVLDLAEVDYDEYFITPPKAETEKTDLFYLFVIPSYNIDSINDNFLEHLRETHHDFRIDTSPLASLVGYSVFGLGDREGWPTEEDGFCFQAKEVDKWMAKLTGRKRAYPLGMGDWKRDGRERLSEWRAGVADVLKQLEQTGTLGDGVPGSGDPVESDGEGEVEDDGEALLEEAADSRASKKRPSGSIDDVEDLGRIMELSRTDGSSEKQSGAPLAIDFTTERKSSARKTVAVATVKEMVPKNSPTYAAL